MITKEHLLEAAQRAVDEMPDDIEGADHETNVANYLKFVADRRRGYGFYNHGDIDPYLWKEVIEELSQRKDIPNGADLDYLLGIRNTEDNRQAHLDYLDGEINQIAARIVDKAEEY